MYQKTVPSGTSKRDMNLYKKNQQSNKMCITFSNSIDTYTCISQELWPQR